MQYTENYSMNKPQFGENALVTKLNENADTLDTLIYNTRQMQADTYDSTQTYNTGDLVSYNSALYICLADNVTGAWDSTKWSATTLAEQVELAKQSGGESALADLEDVNITNPSEGQILTYDDANDEWVNTDMPDTAVTKEATGNPIELTDAASAPLVKCVTEIQGYQDLHGYDKPWVGGAGKNKLPLTVDGIKSANPGGTWNNLEFVPSAQSGAKFTILVDDDNNVIGIKYSGTVSDNTTFEIYTFSTTTDCILNGCPAGGGSTTYRLTMQDTGSDTGNGVDIPANTTNKRVYIRIANGYTSTGIILYPMIRLSTVTDSTFTPYSNICPITAYTEGEIEVSDISKESDYHTVDSYYINAQGEVAYDPGYLYCDEYIKVIGGKAYTLSFYKNVIQSLALTIPFYDANKNFKRRIVAISGTTAMGTLTATFTVNDDCSYIRFSAPINSTNFTIVGEHINHTTTYPSAIYRGSEDVVNGSVECNMGLLDLGNLTWSIVTSGTNTYFRTSSLAIIKVVDNVTNYLCENYEAVAPMTRGDAGSNLANGQVSISNGLTSTNQIMIRNDNYSTAEDFKTAVTGVKIAYTLATPTTTIVTPTNLPIKSLSGYNHIESSTGDMEVEYITEEYQPLVDLIQSGNGHTYSTQEQVVGKWIDGKDLYEKTLVIQNFSASTSDSGWYYGTVNLSDYGINPERLFPQQGETFIVLQDTTPRIPIYIDWQGGTNLYLYFLGSRSGTLTVVVRYTKVTVSRSLNAPLTSQKAQIEPLIAEEEEVPTEEEKAVNEEENTNENR